MPIPPPKMKKNPLKNRIWTFPVVHYFTWKLDLVPNFLWKMIGMGGKKVGNQYFLVTYYIVKWLLDE